MQFTISQESFSDILQYHLPVLPARTTLPILNSIKWDIGDGKIKMHSTDLEITLVTETSAKTEGDGSVAVPARKLSEIVRELPAESVTVTIESNFRVRIQGSTGVYQVAGSDAADFPAIPGDGKGKTINVSGALFKKMVNRTSFAVSKDDMRPTLCGVFLQTLSDELRAVSTDGHRLSKMVKTSFETGDNVFEVIVPVKALNLAAKTVSDDDDVQISVSGNYLRLDLNGDLLFTRLIEGKYPLYENVIPKGNQNTLLVNVEALMAAVRRVSIFSNSLTKQIKFSLSGEKIVITAEDIETGGEAEEELAVDYQGDEMNIGYNAAYVVDTLRQIDSEELKMLIGTPDSACIITSLEREEEEDFMMLLMPVRLP